MLNSTAVPFNLGDVASTNAHWFTLSNRCNIRCKYCFNYLDQNNEDMPADLAVGILDYVINERIKLKVIDTPLRIIFFGGEPR